jgi:hypothetical protein
MNVDGLFFVYSLPEAAFYERIERTNNIVQDAGDGIPRMESFTAWTCVPSYV